MTARQLYYTSCTVGRDGGAGFQVNASTDGIPPWVEALAIRASTYDPPPLMAGPAGEPDDEGDGALPVALGFARAGSVGVVFQSRYVGRDFAGRLGNYFAHAVVLDDLARDLDGLLPIDLWRAPTWVHSPSPRADLPVLGPLAPSPAAGAPATAAFLAVPRSRQLLAPVLTAVTTALRTDRRPVVLVTAGDHDCALWISAVTRSLPRRLALATTFTTYSGRPEVADVVLAGTTPRIPLDAGNVAVVDTRHDDVAAAPSGRAAAASPYADAVAGLWACGALTVRRVVELLDLAEVAADDLDDLAPVLLLYHELHDELRDSPVRRLLEPAEVVSAVQAVLARPGLLRADWPWERVWARVLGSSYAERLPELTADADAPVRSALAQVLEEAPEDDLELAARLPVEAARLVGPAATPGGRADRIVRLALVRHGEADPVDVAAWLFAPTEPPPAPESLHDLVAWLWPDGLDPEAAMRLLDRLEPGSVAHDVLLPHCVANTVDAVRARALRPAHATLADRLLREVDEPVLRAVSLGFRVSRSDRPVGPADLETAVGVADEVLPELGGWLRERLVLRMLSTPDALLHHDLLIVAARTSPARMIPAYAAAARARGAGADAEDLARWIAVWVLADEPSLTVLLERTLPALLERRRGDVDALARALQRPSPDVAVLLRQAGAPSEELSGWWQEWSGEHLTTSRRSRLAALIRFRKS